MTPSHGVGKITLALAISTAIAVIVPLTSWSLRMLDVPAHHQGVAALSLLLAYFLLFSPLLAAIVQ